METQHDVVTERPPSPWFAPEEKVWLSGYETAVAAVEAKIEKDAADLRRWKDERGLPPI